MFSCDEGLLSINQPVVFITPLLFLSSGGSSITWCLSQPLSEVLIPGPPGMWELSGVLAIVDVLAGMIPTANTDRVSPILRGFAQVHNDVIFGKLGTKFWCRWSILSLFWIALLYFLFLLIVSQAIWGFGAIPDLYWFKLPDGRHRCKANWNKEHFSEKEILTLEKCTH